MLIVCSFWYPVAESYVIYRIETHFTIPFILYDAKKNWARNDQKCIIGLYVKYPLLLSDFIQTWFFSKYFPKILKFHENLQVGAALFHADGRTDRHDEANSRFSQFCERA